MRTTKTELTNMLLIEDPQTHAILVEQRQNPNWPGVTFPGGHIEPGETITESVIREAFEETGLTIKQPQLVGVKEWPLGDDARYIVFLYHTQQYSGEIKASREGSVFWTTRQELLSGKFQLPSTFAEMLTVFDDPTINELALRYSDNPTEKWDLSWQ